MLSCPGKVRCTIDCTQDACVSSAPTCWVCSAAQLPMQWPRVHLHALSSADNETFARAHPPNHARSLTHQHVPPCNHAHTPVQSTRATVSLACASPTTARRPEIARQPPTLCTPAHVGRISPRSLQLRALARQTARCGAHTGACQGGTRAAARAASEGAVDAMPLPQGTHPFTLTSPTRALINPRRLQCLCGVPTKGPVGTPRSLSWVSR
jgi:hypothetical protein